MTEAGGFVRIGSGSVSRLFRLVGIVAASALVLTGLLSGLAFVGSGLLHHTATADAVPLPPLSGDGALGGSTVYAADGTTVLAVLQASQQRTPVQLPQVSKILITAVLDTEDHRFFLHGGFDIPSTIRALANDSSSGSSGIQGGSTITQQLVKLTYLTSERKLSRKVKEAVLADRLEREYTKDQILDAYLNTIYLGNGAYGIEAAANRYFNEHASQLTLAQASLLAGLIQNPSGYDPILNPAAARARRSEVLSRMVFYGDATPAQAAAANLAALPNPPPPPPVGDQITDYYVQEVQTELLGANSPLGSSYDQRWEALFEGGLRIYTNLVPNLQAKAEQTIAADTPANTGNFQEAMVSIDPNTGKVDAMVGGPNFKSDHFDIVTQGDRQPGSGFKLFTLLAALEQGYSVYDTVDSESPCAINFPTDHDLLTSPINNDAGPGGGAVTLVNATANSINCAYVRLAHEVGLPNVINVAHQLGISEYLPPYPSIVIGATAVHPIEMAAAYAAVADNGVYHTPSFIDHIVDRSGTTIYTGTSPGQQVFSSQVAEEATVALQAVVQYGTGTAASLYGRPSAGKTGTTTHSVDAWYNGFTPQLETTVWMGNPNGEVPMYALGGYAEVFGADFPARTWHDFMSYALATLPVAPFAPPNGALMSAPHYITSPGLVADDALDHNSVYVAPSHSSFSNPTTNPTSSNPSPGTQNTTASTTPPTVPSTGPPSTVAPPAPPGRGRGNGH
jgi:penicillin-binding protein 1A